MKVTKNTHKCKCERCHTAGHVRMYDKSRNGYLLTSVEDRLSKTGYPFTYDHFILCPDCEQELQRILREENAERSMKTNYILVDKEFFDA